MSGEKTEKATPKRRGEARKKGQVARSPEVNSTVVLLATVSTLALTAPALGSSIQGLLRETLGRAGSPDVTTATAGGLVLHFAEIAFLLIAPVIGAAAIAGLVANVVQNKPSLTPSSLRPDFKKISPKSGLKRLGGVQSWVELVKSLLKVAVVASVAILVIWPRVSELATLGDQTPSAIGSLLSSLVIRLGFFILAVLVPLAIGDVIWQRYQHEKSMKMSKQEVKEESRQQDIAPEIKGAIRRRQAQMSRQRMLAQVPSADVVITNPTHYAVALRYGRDVSAPRVVAKGADLIARRIREIAEENDVAIVENPPLARALFAQVEVDQEIPPDFFSAVAEVLAFVYRTGRRKLSWA
jgi:flagellar biosynthetic protein FlhB